MKLFSNRWFAMAVLLLLVFISGALVERGRSAPPPAAEAPQIVVSGSRIVVHYPGEKRFYTYSELGGNCVFAYRLSTPGGPIERENCK